MDFLGWYSTGDGPTESDIKIHKQVRSKHMIMEVLFVWFCTGMSLTKKIGFDSQVT